MDKAARLLPPGHPMLYGSAGARRAKGWLPRTKPQSRVIQILCFDIKVVSQADRPKPLAERVLGFSDQGAKPG